MLRLIWPIDNIGTAYGIAISQRFGQHAANYSQFGMIGHNGIDISAPRGTPIKAASDGFIVEQTAQDTGYGLRISHRVDDGNKHYLLIYGHMERLEKPASIKWGWKRKEYPVKAGQVIGYVDSTGFSSGHHLHFGVHEYTEGGVKLNSNNGYLGAFDPMPFLEQEFMSNARLVKQGSEYGIYLPATSGDGLITLMRNIGLQPPLKADKTLDWAKVEQMVNGHLS